MITSASLPIGVFDSGLGGLTVLKALKSRFPDENYLYLGDTARLPYGAKSSATIWKYFEQNCRKLEELGIKALVVACNSASSAWLERRNLNARFSENQTYESSAVTVLNVIEPGAQRAIEKTKTKKIGVIGTQATIQGEAYTKALKSLDPEVMVFSQACPLLVPLVEEGWVDDPLTNLVLHRYLQQFAQQGVDTLILGCTHYPVLKVAIQKVVGSGVELIDSAEAIAQQLAFEFSQKRIEKNMASRSEQLELLTTDEPTHFFHQAQQLIQPWAFTAMKWIDLAGV